MKTKWTWSKIVLASAAGLLAVLMLSVGSLSIADHKGKPGGGGGDPPPTAELPDVRYRIKFIDPPSNANGTDVPWVYGINNLGQVVGVYNYNAEDGDRAFVYDPLRNPNQSLDLSEIVTAGVPEGWRLKRALGINDHMVVVGNIEKIGSDPIQVRPIAIDLSTVDPVVDLLPDLDSVFERVSGWRINENGDILGIYRLEDGSNLYGAWYYNPGLYGDPSQRAPRDPAPLDMRDEEPEDLLIPIQWSSITLNNPVENRPAQIAGDLDGVAFRYTLGDAEAEWFPELDLVGVVAGLNDSGTFCGLHPGPKIRGKIKIESFRFNESLDLLPSNLVQPDTRGINSSGDLLTISHVYRDDWGWVKIDDLLVGTDTDMQAWWSGVRAVARQNGINDRGGPSDAGQITGNISDGRIFILTPEPAPTP
jgi:hypothetical protein